MSQIPMVNQKVQKMRKTTEGAILISDIALENVDLYILVCIMDLILIIFS